MGKLSVRRIKGDRVSLPEKEFKKLLAKAIITPSSHTLTR